MKTPMFLGAALAALSVAAHANIPQQYYPAPSLPPYVQPAPTPMPAPPATTAVLVPIGPNTALGAVSSPLPSGGTVTGTTVISPGSGWSVQGTITVPHDLGGR